MLRRKEFFVHDDHDDDDNAIFTGGLAHGGNVAGRRISGRKCNGRYDDRNGRRGRRLGGRTKSLLDKLFQLPSGDRKRSTERISAVGG